MQPTGFLCDEMLADLARWLRAAGHDTRLASGGAADAHWLRIARCESRRLLTRDRDLPKHAGAAGVVLWLPPGDLDATALHLRDAADVDWMYSPFSRCLLDNAPLAPCDASIAHRLPPDVRATDARRCPCCARVYWSGSHARRMLTRLARWSRRETPALAGHEATCTAGRHGLPAEADR